MLEFAPNERRRSRASTSVGAVASRALGLEELGACGDVCGRGAWYAYDGVRIARRDNTRDLRLPAARSHQSQQLRDFHVGNLSGQHQRYRLQAPARLRNHYTQQHEREKGNTANQARPPQRTSRGARRMCQQWHYVGVAALASRFSWQRGRQNVRPSGSQLGGSAGACAATRCAPQQERRCKRRRARTRCSSVRPAVPHPVRQRQRAQDLSMRR